MTITFLTDLAPIAEVWRDVEGGPYQVSSSGNVRRNGKNLVPRVHTNGYRRVTMRVGDGPMKDAYIHRLVCTAFHGAPPAHDSHADHIDSNRANNAASNLRWLSPSDNRALRNTAKGERSGHAKLTDADVARIRRESCEPVTASDQKFADEFGVCRESVRDIRLGKTWSHVMNDGHVMNDQNERAIIGGNNPPEPTPYEQSKERIESLYMEAKNWCDGEGVTSQAQADELQKLMRAIQEAEKEADERRKAEAKPFDDGKAEVQARYNPLIQKDKGRTSLAVQACKAALAPWLKRIDDENRAKAEEARKAAEEARRIADEAIRQRDAANLEEREAAEALLDRAKRAEEAAKKAENAKAQAKGAGRAASLRTSYRAEVSDYTEFARFVWKSYPADLKVFLDGLAMRLVSDGKHSLPGVIVHEEKKVA